MLLQPTLCRFVVVGLLIFFELGKEARDRGDVSCNSLLGREVRRRDPSKWWSGCKEGEEVGGELVSHLDDEMRKACGWVERRMKRWGGRRLRFVASSRELKLRSRVLDFYRQPGNRSFFARERPIHSQWSFKA